MTGLCHANPERVPDIVTRKSERFALDAKVSSRRLGRHACRVRAYDIASLGCRLDFSDRPAIGEILWVKFDGMESLKAMVCWVEGFKVGLRFARPIHPSVLDLLLQRLARMPGDR